MERIDFDSCPETTFLKKEVPTSFKDYYKTQYQETITDLSQPLLVHKDRKTGNEVMLIPELCCLTGLTDSMRADFRLMKDLSVITHTDANKKVQECRHLLDVFTENPKCKEKAALW